ncbi:MAG: hypothetical protein JST22_14865 [Bacteroidetes bacterium]|nr:hypothetical protein [Bacteroidota bacterium]
MNTQTDLRSIVKLLGGCLFCVALAALGFYPFAAGKQISDRAASAPAGCDANLQIS